MLMSDILEEQHVRVSLPIPQVGVHPAVTVQSEGMIFVPSSPVGIVIAVHGFQSSYEGVRIAAICKAMMPLNFATVRINYKARKHQVIDGTFASLYTLVLCHLSRLFSSCY